MNERKWVDLDGCSGWLYHDGSVRQHGLVLIGEFPTKERAYKFSRKHSRNSKDLYCDMYKVTVEKDGILIYSISYEYVKVTGYRHNIHVKDFR